MRPSQESVTVSNPGNVDKKGPAPFTKPSSQKRARLDDDKENQIRQHVETWKIHTKFGAKKEKKVDKVAKDEKALMDDLMAGLDASMFDGLASSPVKSQALSQAPIEMSPVKALRNRAERQMSPVKVKLEKPRTELKSTVATNRSILPIPQTNVQLEVKRVPKAFVPIKLELDEDLKSVPEPKLGVKPLLEDEDEFTFDLDLDELAGMDDDLLLKPHVAAKSIYPVNNPEVPAPPAGYQSTPWMRCTVELVLDGLRFGNGQVPDVLDFSDAGPSNMVGKVHQALKFATKLTSRLLL